MIGTLEAVADRYVTRQQIDERGGNEKGAEAPGSLLVNDDRTLFDAGQAYAENTSWSVSMFKDLRTSTGAEMRFFVPVLNVPFRLIWAYNPHRDAFQPATAFRFGIGTTF